MLERHIRRFGLVCHPTRGSVPGLLDSIICWARESKVEVVLDSFTANKSGFRELGVPKKEMTAAVDLIVVLGGDGSILETVRAFARDGIPIAGINLGHLGFLTLGGAKDAIPIFERLKNGKFRIENRMMLRAEVRRQGKPVWQGIALNDMVIIKGNIWRVIDVDVCVSGTFVNAFRGDGVIFSSPTGSTGYSLSAGGPIVPPWVTAILICPLNTHTLSARPVITSDQETILARVSGTHSKIDLVIDGQEEFALQDGDEIEVSRASEVGRIVVLKPRNFFRVLSTKMKWGK